MLIPNLLRIGEDAQDSLEHLYIFAVGHVRLASSREDDRSWNSWPSTFLKLPEIVLWNLSFQRRRREPSERLGLITAGTDCSLRQCIACTVETGEAKFPPRSWCGDLNRRVPSQIIAASIKLRTLSFKNATKTMRR
jgi:hypothetical protein